MMLRAVGVGVGLGLGSGCVVAKIDQVLDQEKNRQKTMNNS